MMALGARMCPMTIPTAGSRTLLIADVFCVGVEGAASPVGAFAEAWSGAADEPAIEARRLFQCQCAAVRPQLPHPVADRTPCWSEPHPDEFTRSFKLTQDDAK